MRVVVTGGAGFIGVHLCARLLSLGHEVICVDDLSNSWNHSEIDKLRRQGMQFVHHDVQRPFDSYVGDCDRIYNLACPASPIHYQRDPIRTINTAYLGTSNCLEIARKTGARVLLASTSEIYGDPEVHPQHEDYRGNVNTLGPRACYDEGKRAAETLAYCYATQHEVDSRVARIFNTYGPMMSPVDGRLIPNFITQALRNQPLTIYGSGEQTRSFCYVVDTVSGLIRLMEAERQREVPVYNIGNAEERTVESVARLVIELVGSKSSVSHLDLPVDDPKVRCPDISRAARDLEWRPEIGIYEGLKSTIAWFAGRSC